MKWIALLLIVAALPFLWLRGGLLQEPLSTVWEAAKLEVSSKTAVPLATDPPTVLVQSAALDDFLEAKGADGWEIRERLGSGIVFVRGEERKIVTCRAYSARFRICQ